MSGIIRHIEFKALAGAGSVKAITIIGDGPGFVLCITTTPKEQRFLYTQKGNAPRVFKTMEYLLHYLKDDIGVARAHIQFDRWNTMQQRID